MKKAKWAAVILGLPMLAIGVLWIDSYYRAVAAIKAEDERLAKDIAAYRARMKPGIPMDRQRFAARLPGDPSRIEKRHRPLPCAMGVFMSPLRARVDQGHSGNRTFDVNLLSEYRVGRNLALSDFEAESPFSSDQVISALAITQELAKECGLDSILYSFEAFAFYELTRTLPLVSSEDLRRLAENLDLYGTARLGDPMTAEYLMDRAEVLRVLHLKADPTGFIRRPPGWREFFSWRIHLVKCLKEIDEDYQEASRSIINDAESLKHRMDARTEHRRTRSALLTWWDNQWYLDRESTCRWNLARTAVAVVRYREEVGRLPVQLEQLTPKYLPQIPADPLNGAPVRLEEGMLQFLLNGGPNLTWDVRPK